MISLKALNAFSLGRVDIIFFIVLAVLIGLCIAFYFLIPVINKKQYREQRENLKKREAAFKTNVMQADGTDGAGEEASPAPSADEALREDAVTAEPKEDE